MRRLLLLFLVPVFLAACGGSSSPSATTSTTATTRTISGPVEAQTVPMSRPSTAQIAQRCPPGGSTMGCAQQAVPQERRGPAFSLPNLPLFPDVYEGQGAVNWGAVAAWQRSHGWHPAAIFKLGEFRIDHEAARNAQQLRALGFWRAGYWFVRNTGCVSEAGQIIGAAKSLGLKVVVEDDEVPEARGYAACLTPRLLHAGLVVVEYSSPGTNPDSSNPHVRYEWVAAYGPSHPPCLFTCSVGALGASQTIVAWQETDGQFGTVFNIPGLGHGDVSVDFGIEKLGVTPPKPPPPVKVKWTAASAYKAGYNRGFDVHWLQVRHRSVPAFNVTLPRGKLRAIFDQGFDTGWLKGGKR